MIRFGIVLFASALLGAVVWCLAAPPRTLLAADDLASVSPLPDNLWLGVNSCAAMACHGGDGRTGAKGCEYTTWSNNDPHARAYAVLFEPLSLNIARNLGISGHPTKAAECLACHVSGMTAGQDGAHAASSALNPFDGVGCESCHGPAKNWIGVHATAAWVSNEVSPEEKAKLGLVNLSDPAVQVQVCMKCHVGSAEQDVNHRLLGAGHPRLFFEYSGFTDALPRHWAWKDAEPGAAADNPARDWALGQLATAVAALDLTIVRAEAATQQPKNWPQFAEYDCYSCHHDLADPSWRQLEVYAKDQPHLPWAPAKAERGTIPWGTWYYPMLVPLARHTVPEVEPKLLEKLTALDLQMRAALEPASGNGPAVAAAAKETKAVITEWQAQLAGFNFDRQWTTGMIATLAADKDGFAMVSWDSAAQLYIALDKLVSVLQPTAEETAANKALEAITQVLKYPKDYRSPKTFEPAAMTEALKSIREAIHAAP